MIKDIIWDFDGTLFDSYPAMTEAFYKALNEYDINENKIEIYSNLKICLNHTINFYKNKYNIKDSSEILKKFREHEKNELKSTKPFPFALNVCAKIKEMGGKNFLLTHRDYDLSLQLFNKYGFTQLFEELVTKDNNFKRKPDGEAFIYLRDKYNLNFESSIGIGDRTIDALAAKDAGLKTCYFSDGLTKCDTKTDYSINSLEKLFSIIK